MHQTVELDSTFVALAVVMFLLFAIAVLIIVDHKARIPGEIRRDLFSISGLRRNHPRPPPLAREKGPFCYPCHSNFPHAKKPMVRTLLNMHTQFLGCMACHA